MYGKQILLALALVPIAFAIEVARRVITGSLPATFFYGLFLWAVLFASARPAFVTANLRALHKMLAFLAGFLAALAFDFIVRPWLKVAMASAIKGTQFDTLSGVSAALALPVAVSILVAHVVSTQLVRSLAHTTADAPPRDSAA